MYNLLRKYELIRMIISSSSTSSSSSSSINNRYSNIDTSFRNASDSA